MDKQREAFEDWFESTYIKHNLGYSKLDMFAAWQAALESQWQPATKLPPRYEEVIVYPAPSEYCNTAQYGQPFDGCCDGWYYSEYEVGWGVVFHECRPTHWMPLPPEPTT